MNWDQLLLAEFSLIHYPLQKAVNYVRRVIPNRLYNCEWLLGGTEKSKAADGDRRLVTINKISILLSSSGKQKASSLYEGQAFVVLFGICPESLWKAQLCYRYPKITLLTQGVSTMLDYDRNDTCHWQGKLMENTSPLSGRVAILSHSGFASSFSSFKQGWGAEQCDAQKMNEGLLGTLKPGHPAGPVTAPQHMALTFSLWVVTPRISSQCTNSLAIGAQRTWSGTVNAKQSAFKEEQGRKPKADSCSVEQYKVDIIPCHGIEEVIGAWFRAF